MTAINGDGDPITIDDLDAAVKRILDNWEQLDVYDVRTLLEDEGIRAAIEDVRNSFIRIFALSPGWREDE